MRWREKFEKSEEYRKHQLLNVIITLTFSVAELISAHVGTCMSTEQEVCFDVTVRRKNTLNDSIRHMTFLKTGNRRQKEMEKNVSVCEHLIN